MTAAILGFPVSSGCRKQQVATPRGRAIPPCNLAGGVSSFSSPAALFGQPGIAFGHGLKDQGSGNVVSIHSSSDAVERRRNLSLLASEINRSAILAERASADLLRRAVQLRNSLLRVDPNNGESAWKSPRGRSLERFTANTGGGK